jgi:hypothetical protein
MSHYGDAPKAEEPAIDANTHKIKRPCILIVYIFKFRLVSNHTHFEAAVEVVQRITNGGFVGTHGTHVVVWMGGTYGARTQS